MKKFFILTAILLSVNNCFAACPTMNEYQSKLQNYQYQSMNLANSNYQQMDNLYKDMINYVNSIVPGCVAYLSTPNPDCDRVSVLGAAYMTMDSNKQPSAKAQIYGLMNNLSKYCQSYHVDTLKMLVK